MSTEAARELDPLLALIRQQLQPIELRAYQLGEQARVLADSRAGPKSPHVGDVGTVVAIYSRADAMVVYFNCLEQVYLLDFGPDDNCVDGRDTWAFADGDLGSGDAPAPKAKRSRRKKQENRGE